MKRLLGYALLSLILFALSSPALAIDKLGFRKYSTATPATCTVWGMGKQLPILDGTRVQGFSPNPNLSRAYNLGTKGMANYSTQSVGAVKYSCATAAGVAVDVKVFMNGVETYFLTNSADTLFTP